jgi:DNA-binding transcriptional ArsR family regulator|uniref:HTH iclR-type domain-containing protein n=1 Tax=candidate division CPR3 bacterium TaxID=2268181 RepID=A0A7C5URQ5_UNCC3
MSKPVDEKKIQKIINCLQNHPEGTYVSQIARETKLPKTTVSYLLNKHLGSKIEEIITGKKELFKIIKLKEKYL